MDATKRAELPSHVKKLYSFVSHKRVRAGEIVEVTRDGAKVRTMDDDVISLRFEPEMTARYMPHAGDFWLIYADGYQSISPRDAFLEGYTAEGMHEQLEPLEIPREYEVLQQVEAGELASTLHIRGPFTPTEIADIQRAFREVGRYPSPLISEPVDDALWCVLQLENLKILATRSRQEAVILAAALKNVDGMWPVVAIWPYGAEDHSRNLAARPVPVTAEAGAGE